MLHKEYLSYFSRGIIVWTRGKPSLGHVTDPVMFREIVKSLLSAMKSQDSWKGFENRV